ncbi:hypothetical protein EYC84_010054 [Monilinia fructicola]|uniref:Altered inheritance of mitochondria protein 21 n=1 Tax=Monilinia fructicola TaxID=38448 RepID=A0A5M9JBH2_MONFR|nr:hypothetical protein EYC84_010054 [Monilinia fructicola]
MTTYNFILNLKPFSLSSILANSTSPTIMSAEIPQVPPRPNRSQEQGNTSSGTPSLGNNIPQIPPRPANRRADRSISPARESFARSPLNDMPHPHNPGRSSLYAMNSANSSTSELDVPHRPSSVSLPSIGQEGNEYAEAFGASEDLGLSPTQTRNVANDLKLHAPKPSHPESSAKMRVSAVTRTDSSQAAAYGLGRAGDDKDAGSRSLKNKSSFASNASAIERPPSSTGGHEDEHGIPEIGQRVPMYPNAGDVQAPSPSPYSSPYTPGVGFHNDGSKRHHERRISGRGGEVPPGSYGLHGHGIIPHDRFEKAYYEKHPELYKKETASYHGPLGEGRAEWAMSSDDLNRIVRDTASRGAGLGTSPAVMSTPTEQVGFQASEEYASRMSSPRPQSSGQQSGGYNLAHSNTSQTHVDSPLKKESFPLDGSQKAEFEGALSKSLDDKSERAYESEADAEDTIHVDVPSRRSSRIIDGDESRPYSAAGGDDDELRDEHGYSAPILAADEVSKESSGYELQPAVSPSFERRNYYDDVTYGSTPGSKHPSRPGSIHTPAVRATESAPLEEVHEYEPLFPEDEKSGAVEKPETAADRLKRPELQNRKFPSQDVWEDTPNSLQYTATVSTPQLPDHDEDNEDAHKKNKETPEQAFARRQEELAEKESTSRDSFLTPQKKLWSNSAHLVSETRPSIQQRFPSRDVWEDTPDSLQLQTTVSTPQTPEVDTILSPPDERPTTGAVVFHQEKAAAGFELGQDEGRATTGIAAIKPSIPARPVRSISPDRPQPAIPDRPVQKAKQVPTADDAAPPLPLKSKPQIPVRPVKPLARESSENIPLTTVQSNSSAKSIGSDNGTPAVKSKPPVPSRPIGGKIAALQGGFLADLNSRLKLGPQAPKKEEPKPEEKIEEKEKVPLSDARKGRARGPARRAPARSSAPVSSAAQESSAITLAASTPSTLWYIDSDEILHVGSKADPKSEEAISSTTKAAESATPTLATNTAGENLHDATEIAAGAEKSASPPSAENDIQSEQREETQKEAVITSAHSDDAQPEKPSDSPPVASENVVENTTEPEAVAEN